jgi:hypothetical protein
MHPKNYLLMDGSPLSSVFFISTPNPISYCRFKYINVYIFYSFEPGAIPRHTRLAEFFTIRLG